MLSLKRLMQWSLVAGLLFLSTPNANAESTMLDGAEEESLPQDRRQLWDFWSLLFLIGGPPDGCAPLKAGEECRKRKELEKYWAEEGDMDEEYQNFDYTQDADAANVDYSAGTEFEEQVTAGGGGFSADGGYFRVWMVFLAGSVVAAVAAIHMGQRKNPLVRGSNSDMKGAVARRMGAVSAFATGAFASSKGGPPTEVEMKGSAAQPLHSAELETAEAGEECYEHVV